MKFKSQEAHVNKEIQNINGFITHKQRKKRRKKKDQLLVQTKKRITLKSLGQAATLSQRQNTYLQCCL